MAFQPALLLTAADVERRELSAGAWVDVARGFAGPEADGVFCGLVDAVPWQAQRRSMYDRVVDVPRLVRFYDEGEPLPDPALVQWREQLNERYSPALGEALVTTGLCYYRDGRDSVAWHGDTIGRARLHDTVVAIVSLGAERKLALRPVDGGALIALRVSHGDLVVMGGSCQRTWQHAVPKTSRVVGPRISVQFRPLGVR